jgi:hypothetical protein
LGHGGPGEKVGNNWVISPVGSSDKRKGLKNKRIFYGMQIAEGDLSRTIPCEHPQ